MIDDSRTLNAILYIEFIFMISIIGWDERRKKKKFNIKVKSDLESY